MERVTIREASIRLRLPTSEIRQCVQNGELKAYRQPGADGRLGWVVELPEEGWVSAAMSQEIEHPFTPWWWTDKNRVGNVHYIEVLSTSVWEEVLPKFLCGLISDNFWSAKELTQEDLCPQCLASAIARHLPLS